MSMCVNNLKAHEGFKNTMYKDSEGNITVGIGHLLSTPDMAASLPLQELIHGMVMVMIWKRSCSIKKK